MLSPSAKRVSILICGALYSPLWTAQAAAIRVRASDGEYLVESWRMEQGLPSNTVYAIEQTADGYLWLGTRRGLVRFDGVRFSIFHRSNTPALPGHSVTALRTDGQGNLWIGLEHGGLAVYANGTFRPVGGREQARQVFALARGPGSMLAGSNSGVLSIGTSGGVSRIPGLERPTRAVAVDSQGSIWAGTQDSGVVRLHAGAATSFSTREGLPSNLITSLDFDRSGRLWVGTDHGAALIERDRVTRTPLGLPRGNAIVRGALHDSRGAIWIGGWNRLLRASGAGFETLPLMAEEPGNQILAVFEDREGSIWVGTEDDGLFRILRSRLVTYARSDGLPHDSVKCVVQAEDGSMWAGTDDGPARIEGGRVAVPAGLAAIRHSYVRSIFGAPSGAVWFGTSTGLFRWDGMRLAELRRTSGARAPSVFVLAPRRGGGAWLASNAVYPVVGDRVGAAVVGTEGAIVRALIEDRSGRLWVANDAGLVRIEGTHATRLTRRDGLSGDEILSLHEDAGGAIWVGTRYDGLNRIAGGRIARFGHAEGFADGVHHILEDDFGFLWLAGASGIYRVARQELTDHLEGRHERPNVAVLGPADGMLAQESSSGQQPGAWKASDGRLWFGTIHGIVIVDPKAVLRGEPPPPGLIESLTADGREHTTLADLAFPPGVRSVEIRYTSMALRAAGQTAFRRRLLGLNAQWTDAGDQRVAVYVNLAPGEYVFEVSARGRDGVWNSTPARVSFSLRPYFYQTRWFIGLCMLAASLIAFAAYRYRLARMRAEFAAVLGERNRIARELHDTLMQGVAGISVHLEAISALLTTAPEKAADRLERLRGLARGVVEDSRRRIWDLRSSEASGANLIASIGAAARQRTGPAGIHFEMDVSGEPVPLPEKTDDGLLAIAQEAVANAVKHSGSASIRVSLHYGAKEVTLAVEDNGKGIGGPPDSRSLHFGILGMQERAREMKGRLKLDSTPGAGTRISVVVPAKR